MGFRERGGGAAAARRKCLQKGIPFARMFGHMECVWGLFSFISHSIKHHLLCDFTPSNVSN